jgi:hypothetical protein
MNLAAAPRPMLEIGDLHALGSIRAIDLWRAPEARGLWKPHRLIARRASAPAGLPGPGFATPMGYWLVGADEAPVSSRGGFTIEFVPYGEPAGAGSPPVEPTVSGATVPARPAQTVRLKTLNVGDGELVLNLGPSGVRVAGSEAAWRTLAEPVLLAICQYGRFADVEAEIDRLTELAHGDLDHATLPSLETLRAVRRLTASARAVRDLLLDLPHFEGPLTDPYAYCSSERAAATFAVLAEKLRLEAWCELIDERTEAIEDAYGAVSEKLLEYKNFIGEVILEVVIVAILFGELALMIWEQFGP